MVSGYPDTQQGVSWNIPPMFTLSGGRGFEFQWAVYSQRHWLASSLSYFSSGLGICTDVPLCCSVSDCHNLQICKREFYLRLWSVIFSLFFKSSSMTVIWLQPCSSCRNWSGKYPQVFGLNMNRMFPSSKGLSYMLGSNPSTLSVYWQTLLPLD